MSSSTRDAEHLADLHWSCPFAEFGEIVDLVDGGRFPVRAVGFYVDENDGLEARVTVEALAGVIVVSSFQVSSRPGSVDISPSTLRKLDYETILIRVRMLASLAAETGLPNNWQAAFSAATPAQARSIERVAEGDLRRRAVTDDLLRQVASVVVANLDRPTIAVRDHFPTSHRNATRWSAAARDRGFLIDGFSDREGNK